MVRYVHPLKVPMHRRRQTAAVLLLMFGVPGFTIGLGMLLIMVPVFWPLLLMYLAWMILVDYKSCKTGDRMSNWMRNLFLFKHYREFFPAEVVKTAELDGSVPYIFGCHPHGIVAEFYELFPKVDLRICTLTTNFRLPFWRDWLLALGFISASRSSICKSFTPTITTEQLMNNLRKKRSTVIVIGGAAEALEARPGVMKLILKKRYGFCKMAIRGGASLVPTILFGENDVFRQADNPHGSWLRIIQERGKELFGFSMPIFIGRGIFLYDYGFLPRRKKLTTVIGAPIPTVQDDNPSPEAVRELHTKYLNALEALYEEWAPKLGQKQLTIEYTDGEKDD